MSLLCCFPNWALSSPTIAFPTVRLQALGYRQKNICFRLHDYLHRIQHHYRHQEVLIGQRLTELQRQPQLVSNSLNSEYWLKAFFEQELAQQSGKLKQVNQELKRRTRSPQELAI